MNKKIIVFLVISLMLISCASAGLFSDLFKGELGELITGKSIDDITGEFSFGTQTCYDNDPNNNVDYVGRAHISMGALDGPDFSDSCDDNGKLKQVYCDGNTVKNDILEDCPPGETCYSGSCWTPDELAAETDGAPAAPAPGAILQVDRYVTVLDYTMSAGVEPPTKSGSYSKFVSEGNEIEYKVHSDDIPILSTDRTITITKSTSGTVNINGEDRTVTKMYDFLDQGINEGVATVYFFSVTDLQNTYKKISGTWHKWDATPANKCYRDNSGYIYCVISKSFEKLAVLSPQGDLVPGAILQLDSFTSLTDNSMPAGTTTEAGHFIAENNELEFVIHGDALIDGSDKRTITITKSTSGTVNINGEDRTVQKMYDLQDLGIIKPAKTAQINFFGINDWVNTYKKISGTWYRWDETPANKCYKSSYMYCIISSSFEKIAVLSPPVSVTVEGTILQVDRYVTVLDYTMSAGVEPPTKSGSYSKFVSEGNEIEYKVHSDDIPILSTDRTITITKSTSGTVNINGEDRTVTKMYDFLDQGINEGVATVYFFSVTDLINTYKKVGETWYRWDEGANNKCYKDNSGYIYCVISKSFKKLAVLEPLQIDLVPGAILQVDSFTNVADYLMSAGVEPPTKKDGKTYFLAENNELEVYIFTDQMALNLPSIERTLTITKSTTGVFNILGKNRQVKKMYEFPNLKIVKGWATLNLFGVNDWDNTYKKVAGRDWERWDQNALDNDCIYSSGGAYMSCTIDRTFEKIAVFELFVEQPLTSCTTTDDCAEGEFCIGGFCVAADLKGAGDCVTGCETTDTNLDPVCTPYGVRLTNQDFVDDQGIDYVADGYCDPLDTQIKPQMESCIEVDGVIQNQNECMPCNNNFECMDNVCSDGQCVSLAALKAEMGAFKSFICNVLNAIGLAPQEYCAELIG